MSERAGKHSFEINLGAISLPVMACVLAATLLTSNDAPSPPKVDAADETALAHLEVQSPVVGEKVAEIQKKIDAHLSALYDKEQTLKRVRELDAEIAALRNVRDELKASVSEAQERAAVLKMIAEKKAEAEALSNEVAKAQANIRAVVNRIELTGMDEFPQPYISIECKEKEATVYVPGLPERPIRPPVAEDAELSASDMEWLQASVAKTKAVVIFARQGSFENCYWKVYPAVLKAQRAEKRQGNDVAMAFVPIQDSEDITGHILRGGYGEKK
jgi:hypothetical protein